MNASMQPRFSVAQISSSQQQANPEENASPLFAVGERIKAVGSNSLFAVSVEVVAGYGMHLVTLADGKRQERPGYVIRRAYTGEIGFVHAGELWREGCRVGSIRLVK